MAVTKVQIRGHVLGPDGVAPTSGKLKVRLNQHGSTLDGAESVRVGGEIEVALSTGGVLPTAGTVLDLIPNDVITPSGTYYLAEYVLALPSGRRWTRVEKWQFTSADLTLDIGAVPQIDEPSGATWTLHEAVQASVLASATASAAAASASASAAAASEGAALVSENNAAASEVAAGLSEAEAIAARDAALAAGNVYPDTAAGLAAVASGEYFTVPGTGDDSFILYLDNAGVAEEKARFPSTARIDQSGKIDEYPDYAWAITDADRRVAAGIDTAGYFHAHKHAGTTWDVGGVELDATYEQADRAFAVVDSAGRISVEVGLDGKLSGKIEPAEVVTARGTRADLDTRLSVSINDNGAPVRHVWGEWYLRETRMRLLRRLLSEADSLVAAVIGDSWTQGAYFVPAIKTRTTSLYGDAGAGWYGFQNGGIGTAAPTKTGTWTNNYATSTSPDLSENVSSVVGSRISFTVPAGTTAMTLYHIGGVGHVQYRWNGGGWTDIDLAGSGLLTKTLSGATASVTFDIEVVSGTATLCGVDIQSSTNGVRIHKLGSVGSYATLWTAVDATNWQAGLTALAPNLVAILLGTNDQAQYVAGTFSTNLQTMITRVRTALPLADVLIIMPPENTAGRARAMSDYSTAAYTLAVTNKCAFLDLQYVFGETPTEYAFESARSWFLADDIHPNANTGGRAIADAILRLLTSN